MGEGSMKFNICDICGGQHSTDAHATFSTENKELAVRPLGEIFLEITGTQRESAGSKKERTNQIDKDIDLIDKELERLFPESAKNFGGKEEYLNRKLKELKNKGKFTDFTESKFEIAMRSAGSSAHVAHYLFWLTSFLNQGPINSVNLIPEISRNLKGKKILIIGDDIGSLSGALNSFGANAYGLEFSKTEVELAHSGIISENGEPQNQVIEGNAWDLADSSTQLFEKIQELGPFDCIYSYAVYNSGSGFFEYDAGDTTFVDPEKTRKLWPYYLLGIEQLLKKDGIHFGDNADKSMPWYIFGGLDSKIKKSGNKNLLEKWEKFSEKINKRFAKDYFEGRMRFVFRGKILSEIVHQVEIFKNDLESLN